MPKKELKRSEVQGSRLKVQGKAINRLPYTRGQIESGNSRHLDSFLINGSLKLLMAGHFMTGGNLL